MRMLALLLAVTGPAYAEADITGDPGTFDRLEAGIMCVGEEGRREPAPGTRLGYVNLLSGDIVLGHAAQQIPAIPGLVFGVVATVAEGGGEQGATNIVAHPPMGPDGSIRDTWETDFVPGGPMASFFRFEFPEERVPGNWTIQAVAGDRMLCTARFQVVDPGAMPGFVDPCLMPPQIS